MERVAAGRPYVWQQDSAPRHTSGKTQKRLSENFYNFTSPNIWSPNSPECDPMDSYVWGAVEKDTNCTAFNTKDKLITKIKLEFRYLSKDTVKAMCCRFRSHLEAMMEAQDSFFE
ncbi:uncharacterized protein LOC143034085 isoform X2 [Oratosquilla oratoria]|uniref:uncharacterized protein LOC143034085 isoform X2 n=1 Tax=Oratosquilla oratoria TaxID=337810 RepID=UPI003F764943